MNIEDYPLVIYLGRRLRRMPELPGPKKASLPDSCSGCLAMPFGGEHDRALCSQLRSECDPSCNDRWDGEAGIFLPEEHAEEYVVEFVRRRVS